MIMSRTNRSHTSHGNENKKGNKENEGCTESEKRLLKEHIRELNDLISEIEFALSLTTYGKIENIAKLKAPIEYKRNYKLKNIDYILQHELCKLSGFYCSKCTQGEFVFNFSPYSDTRSKPTYAIQLLTENKKGAIGRYVMPYCGMLESITNETPIDRLTGLIPFLRNCRRHIACFVDRKEQYQELRQFTSTLKNIHLDADSTYLLITCSFLQAYNKSSDKLMDITVYLSYEHGKARPSAMSVDWSMKDKPTDNHIKEMKSFVKVFKSASLAEAYHHIKTFRDPVFNWKPEEQHDDQMALINEIPSDSESEEAAPKPARKVSRKRQRILTSDQNEKEIAGRENDQVSVGKKLKRGPRQTTLNFTKQTEKLKAVASSSDGISQKNLKSALTSTPMHKNIKDQFKTGSPGILGISPIIAQNKGKNFFSKTTKLSNKKRK